MTTETAAEVTAIDNRPAPATYELTLGQLSQPLVSRAIELIWREAQILDDKKYEEWQTLYTEDAKYIIPVDPDTDDFESSLNMVYDDARMRHMRVTRLVQGYSMSAVAAARTSRTISRFTVEELTQDTVTLRSAQVLVGFKRDKFQMLGADLTHRVRFAGDDARIELKIIRLVNSDSAVNASGFLL
ncbi:aromatic-ring-hydroxylating dioxygenase subunit beta [Pseudarthrobacter sp. lyk4-40-TYG-27]|uniref:aromatic-ring-hydroxylating dioxygenase subunit beta n=1 Tax=Pseudarthrobacter sp. lyk4-40-TYG-27 TaxID=3040305 RepID=UPI00255596E3|nr:aromatic-ring-hydroxylating dioxygenase subunit beta [Pseudarthrobacter sp. lyk4-40-TYG-27]